MEANACATLKLRAAFRKLEDVGYTQAYFDFVNGRSDWNAFESDPIVADALTAASQEVHRVRLGVDRTNADEVIRTALEAHRIGERDPWVLVGGPPCQAYSLAGRSRRANDVHFEEDEKHFLYKEYLHILEEFAPPIFVMENVKGLLSSTHGGQGMFARIIKDLREPSENLEYDIHSLTVDKDVDKLLPRDFVIQAERFGVPQKRHRIILVGVRKGYFDDGIRLGKLLPVEEVTVGDALLGLPSIRSKISPASLDSDEAWHLIKANVSAAYLRKTTQESDGPIEHTLSPSPVVANYREWVEDTRIVSPVHHQARNHMKSDLERYWYASDRASESGESPRLKHFPESLLPNHKNATDDNHPFEDRFRVQVASKPSSTIVSHMAKDGNYYIHPDPDQMRTLTVREAARLQSFPDNYFFMGTRSAQYHQVGNAVPPLLAFQIAKVVASAFSLHSRSDALNGEPIEQIPELVVR